MGRSRRRAWLLSGAALAIAPTLAMAADPAADPGAASVSEIVVTAQKLDVARSAIEPSLGASTYSMSSATVLTLPGGENTALSQVLLQAPGVVQDSFGQLHIRGDHGNIQYRINNVILPEGL
jgi:outer membrane receptor for ferrienterochelin and colicins